MVSPEFLTDAPDFFMPSEVSKALMQQGHEEAGMQVSVLAAIVSGRYHSGLESDLAQLRPELKRVNLPGNAFEYIQAAYAECEADHLERLADRAQAAMDFLKQHPGILTVRTMTDETLSFANVQSVALMEETSTIQPNPWLVAKDTEGAIITLNEQSELLCNIAVLPDDMRASITSDLPRPVELTPLW